MDQRDYLIILYDFYSELLTLKQREYFEDYYFNNLSLSEISENMTISRNAVHKSLKVVTDKLLEYEDKLKLYHKSLILKDIADTIDNQEIKEKLMNLY